MATAKFHHPGHAGEWGSQTIDDDFDAVWKLLHSGIQRNTPLEPDPDYPMLVSKAYLPVVDI
uniref:hypothetical protein n=1 Tax=Paenibacillus allorhizosphaerae TaxID=2849866 RepID=UPI0038B31898